MSDMDPIDPMDIPIPQNMANGGSGHDFNVCRESYVEGARAALTTLETIMTRKAIVLETGAIAIKSLLEDVNILRDSLPSDDGAVHDSEDNNNEYNNEGDN